MGLDIYLYKYNNYKDTKMREDIYRKESSLHLEKLQKDLGKEYNEMNEREKNKLKKVDEELAEKLKLDNWGEDITTKECIEINHEKYPDHYFKIGYFRSSYNSGGINQKLGTIGLPTLYDIFEHGNDDEYCFQPIWENCLEKLKDVHKKLQKIISDNEAFGVVESYDGFGDLVDDHSVKSSEAALKIFLEEKRRDNRMNDYSNRTGEFYFGNPLEVVGIITGVKKKYFTNEYLPCQYLIYKDNLDWYLQAVEIMIATVEYVLAQSDKEKYYLHWSG
jgi:hypothetical protein